MIPLICSWFNGMLGVFLAAIDSEEENKGTRERGEGEEVEAREAIERYSGRCFLFCLASSFFSNYHSMPRMRNKGSESERE